MAKKEVPTLAEHVAIGQAIKDADRSIHALLKLSEPYLTQKERNKLMDMCAGSLKSVLCSMQSRLEDVMFDSYPWLTHEAIGVYYRDDVQMTAYKLRELGRNAWLVDRNYFGSMPNPNGKKYKEEDMR